MKLFGLIVGLFLINLKSSDAKLPSSIHVCSRNDPDLAKCVIKSVNHLQPRLASGKISEDFIVPALEPLLLENIKIERGREFRAIFSKISVKGPSNFVIEKLRVDLANTTFDIIITLPRIEFTGKFNVKMRILVIEFNGSGDMKGVFEKSKARVRMRAQKYQKNGQTYMKFDTFNIKILPGTQQVYLNNLFNGNKNLEEIAPSVQVCSRNDPDLSRCIIKSVTNLQPRLACGRIADDFVVPALEPLLLDTIKIERGAQFKANFAKIIVRGASNFKIDNLRANLQETTFEMLLTLPKLEIAGKYDIKMKILLVDFNGQGDLEGTFCKYFFTTLLIKLIIMLISLVNTKALIKMRGRRYQKNGQTYMKFDTFGLKIKNGPVQLKLTNLFRGNKSLEEIGNRFINENVQNFIEEINPGLEKSLAQHFTKVANEIISVTSLEDAFPEVAPRYN
ncbi:unnamed protein product [Diamesa hyperborea]